jgi:hypothetical protein
LDECLSPRALEPLGSIYPDGHEFLSANSEGLTGVKDLRLFEEIRLRGFGLFVTVDRAQLRKQDEVAAIRAGSCSWLGFHQVSGKGASRLARLSSLLLETVTFILDNPVRTPHAYSAMSRGREHHQLFSSVQDIRSL